MNQHSLITHVAEDLIGDRLGELKSARLSFELGTLYRTLAGERVAEELGSTGSNVSRICFLRPPRWPKLLDGIFYSPGL